MVSHGHCGGPGWKIDPPLMKRWRFPNKPWWLNHPGPAMYPSAPFGEEKLPSLHGLGYELARLRHLGREEAPAADEFLRSASGPVFLVARNKRMVCILRCSVW